MNNPVVVLVVFWLGVLAVSVFAVVYGFSVGTGQSYIIAAIGIVGLLSMALFGIGVADQRRRRQPGSKP